MTGLIAEDPIAAYLIALFEDDDFEAEEDAILSGCNAAGARADDTNAPVRSHDRLSPIALFFAAANHRQHFGFPPTRLMTPSDRFAPTSI
jgi:hypothetical protein